MSDSDQYLSEESYEFEFEDDDEIEIDQSEDNIEQSYYNSKSLKDEDPKLALVELAKLSDVAVNDENKEWIFRARKQLVKIAYNRGYLSESLKYLTSLVKFIPNVGKAYAEESLTRILANYSKSPNNEFVQEMCKVILEQLNACQFSKSVMERIWIRIMLIRLNIYTDLQFDDQCQTIIDDIEVVLESTAESNKNFFFLEALSAEISFYMSRREINISKLVSSYKKSRSINSAVGHPKAMGIIKECSAKVHFVRKNYDKARLNFYEAFKNYDEMGSPLKKKALKFFIWCGILTENEMNPFDSQETQIYADLKEFSYLIKLISYYDELNLSGVLEVLRHMNEESDVLMTDTIIKGSDVSLVDNLKKKILVSLSKAYNVISFDAVARKIQLSADEMESFVLDMVNKGTLSSLRLDFINKCIHFEQDFNSRKLISKSLTSKDILDNFRCLQALQFNITQEGMNRSTEVEESTLSFNSLLEMESSANSNHNNIGPKDYLIKKFLILSFDEEISENQMLVYIKNWLSCINSGIPKAREIELSQKDQVIIAQKSENENNKVTDHNRREEFSGTSNALLNMENYKRILQQESESNELTRDTINSWIKELSRYQLGASSDPK